MIYCIMFEAVPRADNPNKNDFAGTFINCWVDSIDVDSAMVEAENYIKDEGWEIISIRDKFTVNRKQYEGEDQLKESLECFDQAIKDGIVAIFYTWPYDA